MHETHSDHIDAVYMKALNQGYFLRKNAKEEYYALLKNHKVLGNLAYQGFVAGGNMAQDEEDKERLSNEIKAISKKNGLRKK